MRRLDFVWMMFCVVCLAASCATVPSSPVSTVTPERLAGVWTLGCVSNSKINPDRAFMKGKDVFSDGKLESEVRFFKDHLCEVPGNPKIRNLVLSVSYPDGVTATEYGEAKHLNASIERIEYDGTELTSESKDSFYEAKGRLIHDIYTVKNGKLIFGYATSKYDGSTNGKRFRKLLYSHKYDKK